DSDDRCPDEGGGEGGRLHRIRRWGRGGSERDGTHRQLCGSDSGDRSGVLHSVARPRAKGKPAATPGPRGAHFGTSHARLQRAGCISDVEGESGPPRGSEISRQTSTSSVSCAGAIRSSTKVFQS